MSSCSNKWPQRQVVVSLRTESTDGPIKIRLLTWGNNRNSHLLAARSHLAPAHVSVLVHTCVTSVLLHSPEGLRGQGVRGRCRGDGRGAEVVTSDLSSFPWTLHAAASSSRCGDSFSAQSRNSEGWGFELMEHKAAFAPKHKRLIEPRQMKLNIWNRILLSSITDTLLHIFSLLCWLERWKIKTAWHGTEFPVTDKYEQELWDSLHGVWSDIHTPRLP